MSMSDYVNIPEVRLLFEEIAQKKMIESAGGAFTLSQKEVANLGYKVANLLGVYNHGMLSKMGWINHYAYSALGWDYYNGGQEFLRAILAADLAVITLQRPGQLLENRYTGHEQNGSFIFSCVRDVRAVIDMQPVRNPSSVQTAARGGVSGECLIDAAHCTNESKWLAVQTSLQNEGVEWEMLSIVSAEEVKRIYLQRGNAGLSGKELEAVRWRFELEDFLEHLLLTSEGSREEISKEFLYSIIRKGAPELLHGERPLLEDDRENIRFLFKAEKSLFYAMKEIQKMRWNNLLISSRCCNSADEEIAERLNVVMKEREELEDCYVSLQIKNESELRKFNAIKELTILDGLMAFSFSRIFFSPNLESEKNRYPKGSVERRFIQYIIEESNRTKDVCAIIGKKKLEVQESLAEIEEILHEQKGVLSELFYRSVRSLQKNLERMERSLSLAADDEEERSAAARPIFVGKRGMILPFRRYLPYSIDSVGIDISDGSEKLIIPGGEDVLKDENGFIILDFSQCFYSLSWNRSGKLMAMKNKIVAQAQRDPSFLMKLIGDRKDGTLITLDFDRDGNLVESESGNIKLYYDKTFSRQTPSEEKRAAVEVAQDKAVAIVPIIINYILSGRIGELSYTDIRAIISFMEHLERTDFRSLDPVFCAYMTVFDTFRGSLRQIMTKKRAEVSVESLEEPVAAAVVPQQDLQIREGSDAYGLDLVMIDRFPPYGPLIMRNLFPNQHLAHFRLAGDELTITYNGDKDRIDGAMGKFEIFAAKSAMADDGTEKVIRDALVLSDLQFSASKTVHMKFQQVDENKLEINLGHEELIVTVDQSNFEFPDNFAWVKKWLPQKLSIVLSKMEQIDPSNPQKSKLLFYGTLKLPKMLKWIEAMLPNKPIHIKTQHFSQLSEDLHWS